MNSAAMNIKLSKGWTRQVSGGGGGGGSSPAERCGNKKVFCRSVELVSPSLEWKKIIIGLLFCSNWVSVWLLSSYFQYDNINKSAGHELKNSTSTQDHLPHTLFVSCEEGFQISNPTKKYCIQLMICVLVVKETLKMIYLGVCNVLILALLFFYLPS